MPFKSQAQQRKLAQLLVDGKISNETFEEWNRETGRKKLPERAARKAGPPTKPGVARSRDAAPNIRKHLAATVTQRARVLVIDDDPIRWLSSDRARRLASMLLQSARVQRYSQRDAPPVYRTN